MLFVSPNDLINGAVYGNGNGLIVNDLNGAMNWFVKKDKEVKIRKEKGTPALEDNGGCAEEESEENMPPIPSSSLSSL